MLMALDQRDAILCPKTLDPGPSPKEMFSHSVTVSRWVYHDQTNGHVPFDIHDQIYHVFIYLQP